VSRKKNNSHKSGKILIISDIHGNYEALKALPEDYDELWVLGDLVNYGPQPSEVIDYVKSRAALAVRGNHDHSVGYGEDPRCSPLFRGMADATGRYTESVLTAPEKELLRSLPLTADCVRRRTKFHLCHAAPSDPLFQYRPPESDRWPLEVKDLSADVLLVGHTHIQFTRRIGDCLIVNPGSLGQPKNGAPEAHYALWQDGEVFLRAYSYPVERTIERIRSMPIDRAVQELLIQVLNTGFVGDTDSKATNVQDQRSGCT
jgi:protein phosphatase